MSTTISGSGYSRTPITQTSAATTITTFDYTAGQSGLTTDSEFDQVGFYVQYATGKDGKFCESKVEVRCPYCAYPNHPFKRKKRPVCVETGEEWAGIDHKEAYAHYQCICVYCDEAYKLRLFG